MSAGSKHDDGMVSGPIGVPQLGDVATILRVLSADTRIMLGRSHARP